MEGHSFLKVCQGTRRGAKHLKLPVRSKEQSQLKAELQLLLFLQKDWCATSAGQSSALQAYRYTFHSVLKSGKEEKNKS